MNAASPVEEPPSGDLRPSGSRKTRSPTAAGIAAAAPPASDREGLLHELAAARVAGWARPPTGRRRVPESWVRQRVLGLESGRKARAAVPGARVQRQRCRVLAIGSPVPAAVTGSAGAIVSEGSADSTTRVVPHRAGQVLGREGGVRRGGRFNLRRLVIAADSTGLCQADVRKGRHDLRERKHCLERRDAPNCEPSRLLASSRRADLRRGRVRRCDLRVGRFASGRSSLGAGRRHCRPLRPARRPPGTCGRRAAATVAYAVPVHRRVRHGRFIRPRVFGGFSTFHVVCAGRPAAQLTAAHFAVHPRRTV